MEPGRRSGCQLCRVAWLHQMFTSGDSICFFSAYEQDFNSLSRCISINHIAEYQTLWV